jgi:hypothetical protein
MFSAWPKVILWIVLSALGMASLIALAVVPVLTNLGKRLSSEFSEISAVLKYGAGRQLNLFSPLSLLKKSMPTRSPLFARRALRLSSSRESLRAGADRLLRRHGAEGE